MKTRLGFVSNSSSSSFVVSMKEPHVYPEPKDQLTEEDMKKLREYGFEEIKNDDSPPVEFQYEVSCNQDEVLEFLLKNKIPFEAECHYGHYQVFYDKKTDRVIEAWNYGCEIATYGPDMVVDEYMEDHESNHPAIKVCSREEYLKNEL